MPEAECVICKEVISHPICPLCLEQELIAWLKEARPELIPAMRSKVEEIWFPIGDVNCLKCQTPMDLCAYCFTNHILHWLLESPKLIPQFIQFFNYDLHYHGYAKELLEYV